MLKCSAIFLLLVFAWSQYAKQVSYLECRLSNSFKSFAVKCDCEKKMGLDKPDNNNLPLSKGHTHTHPDELFPVTKTGYPGFSFPTASAKKQMAGNEDSCEGLYNKPFRPPRV